MDDGKSCWTDNIYIERLWRSIKKELVKLHRFETVSEIRLAIAQYVQFYNEIRPHQSLGYFVPDYIIGSLNMSNSQILTTFLY